ncbi:protein RALF-like 19 [Corylus avellana]|uniref:protein RALF-like 19 n=1 Tax=Corylus avellana TaxID=13451 RepID=UPI001E22F199|nr:protein RALF-like 19 [Corylus avellana]XP_059440365.1 protein RALF-like 19 [Corylus avellana]
MEFKPCLVFLLLALAVAAESASLHDAAAWGLTKISSGSGSGLGSCNGGSVGECIGEEAELLMESHQSRHLAARHKFISYAALRANSIPCGRRGNSYYNCQKRQKANPYRRGCSRITHCARITN